MHGRLHAFHHEPIERVSTGTLHLINAHYAALFWTVSAGSLGCGTLLSLYEWTQFQTGNPSVGPGAPFLGLVPLVIPIFLYMTFRWKTQGAFRLQCAQELGGEYLESAPLSSVKGEFFAHGFYRWLTSVIEGQNEYGSFRIFYYRREQSKAVLGYTLYECEVPAQLPHIVMKRSRFAVPRYPSRLRFNLVHTAVNRFQLYVEPGEESGVAALISPEIERTFSGASTVSAVELYEGRAYFIHRGTINSRREFLDFVEQSKEMCAALFPHIRSTREMSAV